MANLVHRRGARAKVARAHGAVVEYLAFRLDTDLYAVPVATIREIVRPPPITPVPRAPRVILGIMSGRGRVVTVVDARRKLSLPEAPLSGRTRLLVTEQGTERIGLLVDEVLMVYRLGEGEIERAAQGIGSDIGDYIAGIARPIDVRNEPGIEVRLGGAAIDLTPRLPAGLGARSAEERGASNERLGVATEVVLILLDLKALLATNWDK